MGSLSTLSDSELVIRLADRDMDALAEIYGRYAKRLLYHANKILGNEAAAQDLIQDLFAHLIVRMETLKINGPLEAYLVVAVRNRCINTFHKEEHKKKYIDGIKIYLEQGESVTEDTVLVNELIHRIDAAVAGFSDKMREVYNMSREGEMSRKEIAEATGNTETNVNYYINKARKILKTKINCWFFY